MTRKREAPSFTEAQVAWVLAEIEAQAKSYRVIEKDRARSRWYDDAAAAANGAIALGDFADLFKQRVRREGR